MDALQGAGAAIEVPRLTMLARTAEGWAGDVERCAEEELRVRGGDLELRMGASRLSFRDGAYRVEAFLPRHRLAARLRLVPVARPALTSSVALGTGAMHWFVVPRLAAEGEVTVRGRRFLLAGAPAYHDHDWGSFRWGGDFSWEWAVALSPEQARAPRWSVVVQRISDRARLRALSQGVLVWRDASHLRTFQGRDVSVHGAGNLPARGALRVPRVMSLVAPGSAADLPRRLEVRAASGRDALEASFELTDLAQVAIPDEAAERGATVISEAHARAQLAGRVRGEALRFEGPALVELNRGAA
jgi:hypothetical protein